ncbi:histone chaperone [Enterocytozoon bieneusi H348]|nr:histone chaperone [Enterocytozoon bieneusi H348]|eukprot:XP_001828070.1 histone chaperone [Enterocytozoon bieneusi H348]
MSNSTKSHENSTENFSDNEDDVNDFSDNLIQIQKCTFDTQKIYKYNDKFSFKIDLLVLDDVNEDVIVKIVYFGSYGTLDDEQILEKALIGPFTKGEHSFEITTDNEIQLHKVDARNLFGLNTVLLSFSINNVEFTRIGYVVNVIYPGIKESELLFEDEFNDNEIEEEEEEEEDEIYESNSISNDNITDENNNNDMEYNDKEPSINNDDNENDFDEYENSGHIETPVKQDQDEFEFKDKVLLKSKIQFHFMEDPIIQLFEFPIMEKNEIDADNINTKKTKISKN